jgi:hypothetical protein
MLNVQALTQTLSAMPLNQLQQYAQLHRNDPYVVTMALSIANQKKQAMTAQQGQAGMQPQPKVVDSELAQMVPQQMPEDQGIGQLPAGNMDFADGGIVAFADGGDVERYQLGGITPRNSLMGDIPGFVAGTGNIIPQQGAPQQEPILRRLYRELNERSAAARDMEERRRVAEGRSAPSERLLAEAAAAKANPAQDMAQFDAATNLYMTERAAKQAAAAAPSVGAAPPARPAPANTGIGQLPTNPGAVRVPSQTDHIAQFQAIQDKLKAVDPAEAERKALGDQGIALAEAAQSRFDAEEAARGDVFKGRAERISKQEGELDKRKATNEGLAFLNAGLAIMSTPGGLAAAIGKGARVGTEQYASGLEKIQAAQDKLGEAQDRLEELRTNRADLTAQQRRALQTQADNAKMDAKKMGIEGIMAAAGVKEKQAAVIMDATTKYGITQIEQSGLNARANAQIAATLNTPERQMWNQALANHKGDTAAAFKELQTAKAEKFNPYQSYADYLKAFAGKDTTLMAPPMSFTKYASQFAPPEVPKPIDIGKADRP